MSNYRTKKQINSFGLGMFIMIFFQCGLSLCNLGGWTMYLGIPMVIFTVIFVWSYTMEKPKNQEDEV